MKLISGELCYAFSGTHLTSAVQSIEIDSSTWLSGIEVSHSRPIRCIHRTIDWNIYI